MNMKQAVVQLWTLDTQSSQVQGTRDSGGVAQRDQEREVQIFCASVLVNADHIPRNHDQDASVQCRHCQLTQL